MNFRCKFRHRRSIPRPRFPIRLQNFGDLATFSVDYCILYSECLPHFYFRFVSPTDLESIPHASTPTLIIPTKFEVGMCIHCRVIAFLSADTSCDLVTLTYDLLTLTVAVHGGSRDQLWFMRYNVSHWLPMKMRTRPLRMRRITWPVSRGSKTITFLESPTPICLFTIQLKWLYDVLLQLFSSTSIYSIGLQKLSIIKVICENNARPVLKNAWDSAHARNHVICLRWLKCLNAVVLADVDLPHWTSKVEHI